LATKKAHITAFLKSFTLKLFLFIFFLFSVPLFISPGAVAEDFCNPDRITPPKPLLAGEPPITRELADRLLRVAPTFEPLEASSGASKDRHVADEEDTDDDDGGDDGGEDVLPVPPTYEDGFVAPDITRGPENRMELSITFDGGGYDDKGAVEILKVLRERGIKTTIFLTGRFISKYPEIARMIAEYGHEVGNHTFDHPHLTKFAKEFSQKTLTGVDKDFLAAELKKTRALFKEATGSEMAPLWRAPYGEENTLIRRWALDEGYVHVGWTYGKGESLDTLDWVDDHSSRFYHSPEEIKDRVLGFGRNGSGVKGGIILMHLSTNRNPDRMAAMLGELLDGLTNRGYKFVKVSELLRDNRVLKAMENRGLKDVTAKNAAVGEKGSVKTPEAKALNRAQAPRGSPSPFPL